MRNPSRGAFLRTIRILLVASIVVVWAGLLAASFYGTRPATDLVALGHEARHAAFVNDRAIRQ